MGFVFVAADSVKQELKSFELEDEVVDSLLRHEPGGQQLSEECIRPVRQSNCLIEADAFILGLQSNALVHVANDKYKGAESNLDRLEVLDTV